MPQKSSIVETLRRNAGGEIAALSVALVAGGLFAVWRASRRAEPDIDAQTWARLVPAQPASSEETATTPSQEA